MAEDIQHIAGLAAHLAAGKDEIAKIFEEKGYKLLVLSDLLREELKRRGKEISRDSLTELSKEWREEQGFGAMALEAVREIRREWADYVKAGKILIVGIRSPEEAWLLERVFPQFKLAGVVASENIREGRYLIRAEGRSEDVALHENFQRQMAIERFEPGYEQFGQNISACLEMADYIIPNEKDFVDGKLPPETVEATLEVIRSIEGQQRTPEGQQRTTEGPVSGFDKESE